MAIPEHHNNNFQTMLRAANDRNLCLMECNDIATGKPVMVVCMVNEVGDEYQMVPVAKLFDGNPYEEVAPPIPQGDDDEEEHNQH